MSNLDTIAHTAGDGFDDSAVAPLADRIRSLRWRDPRLWAGVAIVLISVLVGARLLATNDDTVAVWKLKHGVAAGSLVESDDLDKAYVHFDDASDAAAFVSADTPPPTDVHYARSLGAGEFLPSNSITSGTSTNARLVPLQVGDAGVPIGLADGATVDLWSVPATPDDRTQPVLVARSVVVASIADSSSAAAGDGAADTIVMVQLDNDDEVRNLLTRVTGRDIVLVVTGS